MICHIFIAKSWHILVQFFSLTKILFPRDVSTRKTVPTSGVLNAPSYPTSHYKVYMTYKILSIM
jgi:hypothetical protein